MAGSSPAPSARSFPRKCLAREQRASSHMRPHFAARVRRSVPSRFPSRPSCGTCAGASLRYSWTGSEVQPGPRMLSSLPGTASSPRGGMPARTGSEVVAGASAAGSTDSGTRAAPRANAQDRRRDAARSRSRWPAAARLAVARSGPCADSSCAACARLSPSRPLVIPSGMPRSVPDPVYVHAPSRGCPAGRLVRRVVGGGREGAGCWIFRVVRPGRPAPARG